MTREEIIQLVQETFFADTDWVNIGKAGFTPKKQWQSNVNYEELDVVQYEGSLYIALEDNNNKNPDEYEEVVWMLAAEHGKFTEQQLEDFKAEVVAESKEEMDDYTDDKKAELDTYEGTKETELNTYTGTKKTELDTYTGGLKDDFDDNASTKTTAFNDNATSKTTAFNTNATNKTTDFNDNATAKTTKFNTNASDKTDDFDDNAAAKTTAFDEHVEEKEEEFDENVESLQQEIDELSENMPWAETEQATEIQVTDAAKYSRNKLSLFGNTEQTQYTGKNLFDMSDTAQYGTITDGVFTSNELTADTYSNICRITAVTPISVNEDDELYISFDARLKSGTSNGINTVRLQASDNTILNKSQERISESGSVSSEFQRYVWKIITNTGEASKFYLQSKASNAAIYEVKNIMVSSSSDTDYEPYTGGVPSPNPDYPQDIHVVTGNNIIKNMGKNLLDCTLFENNSYCDIINKTERTLQLQGHNNFYVGANVTKKLKPNTQYTIQANATQVGTNARAEIFIINSSYDGSGKLPGTSIRIANSNYATEPVKVSCTFTTDGTGITNIFFYCNHQTNSTTITYEDIQLNEGTDDTYDPTNNIYPINLGSLELCKIGDYQDYLYKENGNWYKRSAIKKVNLGNITWTLYNNAVFYSNHSSISFSENYLPYCEYFTPSTETEILNRIYYNVSNNHLTIRPSDDFIAQYNTAQLFKQWLLDNDVIAYIPITPTSTQITDETLISQLDAIYEHLQLVKGTNNITVTPSDLAPYMELTYMQDLPSKLNNLASRIELLEE